MFAFNVGNVLAKSTLDIMDNFDNYSGDGQSRLYYFSGPVPDSLEDAGFDTQDIFALVKNSVAMSSVKGIHSATVNTTTRNVIQYNDNYCGVPAKKSVWDERRQRYRVAPSSGICRYDLSGYYLENTLGGVDLARRNETEDKSLSYVWYYGDSMWMNSRRTNDDVGYYGILFGGRYAFRDDQGAFFEYEQPVSIDSIEFWQYGGTTLTSSVVVFSWWDDTLNEGQGDWVDIYSDSIYNADKEFLWELPETVTSTKFKFSGSNTGSGSWYMREVSLMSQDEPYNNETVDITWALWLPHGVNTRTSFFQFSYTESHTQQGYIPMMLVDVGEPGDTNKMVTLNKARNLPGYFNVHVLNFDVSFDDPQM